MLINYIPFKTFDIIDVITEVGKEHNATPAQIALAWVRQQPGITSTIIGAKTGNQLNDNIKSTEITLSTAQLDKIDAVSALQKEYPQWMVERQSGGRPKK